MLDKKQTLSLMLILIETLLEDANNHDVSIISNKKRNELNEWEIKYFKFLDSLNNKYKEKENIENICIHEEFSFLLTVAILSDLNYNDYGEYLTKIIMDFDKIYKVNKNVKFKGFKKLINKSNKFVVNNSYNKKSFTLMLLKNYNKMFGNIDKLLLYKYSKLIENILINKTLGTDTKYKFNIILYLTKEYVVKNKLFLTNDIVTHINFNYDLVFKNVEIKTDYFINRFNKLV